MRYERLARPSAGRGRRRRPCSGNSTGGEIRVRSWKFDDFVRISGVKGAFRTISPSEPPQEKSEQNYSRDAAHDAAYDGTRVR